jgi:hypothetical protein
MKKIKHFVLLIALLTSSINFANTVGPFNDSQPTSLSCKDDPTVDVSLVPTGCGFHWGYGTTSFNSACLINDNNTLPSDPNLTICSFTTCSNQFLLGFSQGGSISLGNNLTQTYTLYIFTGTNTPAVVTVSNYSTVLTLPAPGTYTIAAYTPSNSFGCSPPVLSPTLQPSDVCCCRLLEVTYVQPNCNIVVTPTPLCAGQPFCFYNFNNQSPIFNTNIQVLTTTVVSSAGCFTAGLPAGTYTIKVKAEAPIYDQNGDILSSCICNNSLVITVNPQPIISEVTASPVAGCIGETTTLTAFTTGANSYTWLPGPLLGNPAAVTITANQTYTVIAGNSGCTATNVVSVFTLDCCKNPNAGSITLKNITIIPYNPASTVIAWFSLSPNGTYANMQIQAPSNGTITGQYTVDGILTVNAPNIVIIAADIYFTEGSFLRQFQTMTITRSYFHACSYMWRGIRSYAQLTMTGCIIEDAQHGVFPFVAVHPSLYLENNVFNINFDAINLAGISFATNQSNNPAFYCAGNIFTSKTLPSSVYNNFTAPNQVYVNILAPNLNSYAFQAIKGSTLLAIASNQTARNGINFASVTNTQAVRVGESDPNAFNNALRRNYFNLLKHGIEVLSSKVNVVNCVFDNFPFGGSAGAGIYQSAGVIRVGQPGPPVNNQYLCRFNNCNYGIYTTLGGTLTAEYNLYTSCRRANGIEFLTGNTLIKYNNNTLTECQLDLYSFSNTSIARITFELNTATGTYSSGSRRHHVFINELSPASSPTYVITYNTLTGKDIGVFMQNTNKSNIVGNTITTNILSLLPNTHYSGIELSAVRGTWINDNTVSNAAPNVNMNDFVRGIYSASSINNTYACNIIFKTGVSMLFAGGCPSNIYKNSLNAQNPPNPCKYGILLDNFGFTGPIGFTTAATPTAFGAGGNKFGDFNYANGGFDTYSRGTSMGSPIYYNGSNILANPFFPSANGFVPVPPSIPYSKAPTTDPNLWACGSGIQGVISPGVGPFFGSSLNFSSNTANSLLIGRKGIYEFFKTNAVNTNTVSGATAFMTTCSGNCIGTMFTIDSLASSQNTVDVQSANILNNSFNATNIVEQTQKDFNALYCAFKLNNNSLTSTEVSQLTSIAQQCPFTDGSSVFQARALLTYFDSTEYYSVCETGANQTASREAQFAESISISEIALGTLVYPNPAEDELFIQCKEENFTVIIYSVIGQAVLNEKLTGSYSKVNIEKLSNGTYFYKIIDHAGQLIKSDKLIINK